MVKKIGVAILGLGVVGGGTYQTLVEHREFYKTTQQVDISVESVLDLSTARLDALGVPAQIRAKSIQEVIANPSVEIVIETIGGIGVAKDFVTESGKFTACTAQTATLTELMGNKVDFVVIDKTMAKTIVGNGNYADLAMVESIEIPSEEYSIGFKKGSELTAKVNGALETLAANGTMKTLAEKYGLENYVITEFNK